MTTEQVSDFKDLYRRTYDRSRLGLQLPPKVDGGGIFSAKSQCRLHMQPSRRSNAGGTLPPRLFGLLVFFRRPHHVFPSTSLSQFILHVLLGMHHFEPFVLFVEFRRPGHQTGIYTAMLGAKARVAHPMLATQISHRHPPSRLASGSS